MSNGPTAAYQSKCLEAVATSRDWGSFEVLFDHFVPRLNTCYCGQWVASDAVDDLAQETMIKLWSKAAVSTGRRGSRHGFFAIARNLRVTGLCKPCLVRVEIDVSIFQDSAPKPDEMLVAGEIEARLHQELREHPQAQVGLSNAAFFDEKSHLDIARERAMPLGMVKSNLRRI